MTEKVFAVKFMIKDGRIHTEMQNKDVNNQEAIGLLEMAKSQILDSLKVNRKEIFKSEIKKEAKKDE